ETCQLASEALPVEVLEDGLASGGPKLSSQFRTAGKLADSLGQMRGIAHAKVQGIVAGDDQLGCAAGSGGNDRSGAGHGLDNHTPKWFRTSAGMNHNIQGADGRRGPLNESGEADVLLYLQLSRQPAEFFDFHLAPFRVV